MYDPKEVGERLRSMRKAGGYSREWVARSIGRSAKYYADIERGICGMSLETLIGLSDFFHVSLDYLVNGAGEEVPDEQAGWAMQRIKKLDEPQKRFVAGVLEMLEVHK